MANPVPVASPGSQASSTDQTFARLFYLSRAVAIRTSPSDGNRLAVLRYACAHLRAPSIFAARKLRHSEKDRDDDCTQYSPEVHGHHLLLQYRRIQADHRQ